MAINPAVLTPSTPLNSTATVLYQVPSNGQAVIKRAVFTNVDSVTRVITVHRVPASGSPVLGNRVISEQRLTPGEAYVAPELANMVLLPGESIQALADAAAVVNATMSGFTL